ncbi:MAG TPA: protein phosphatase 2C domain-containing protein [Pyrinomonadaceae bacterium]|nr:protein phosphatase 2C domain-containing protein [Pyrinomonadaceae bacterium]
METNFKITSGAISDRGLSEKRPQNEDSYLEMVKCGIYAVADGVGGAQAGEVASQMAVEIIGEAFTNRHDGDDAESVMREAIRQANTAIHQMAHELPQLSNMATTIVALHISGSIATIGHVGDSRLYRVDRDGNLFAETADHSMVAEEVRAGRMTAEQAENHPSRNIISRALGAESNVDIELKTIMIEPGTAFLLCSDGITRHVNDQEIKGVLTFGGSPNEICEYLKGLCYERGAEDNLTAVVVKVSTANISEPQLQDLPTAFETLVEIEEPTVATARSSSEELPSFPEEEELLELETSDLAIPNAETLKFPAEPADNLPELNNLPQTESSLGAPLIEKALGEPAVEQAPAKDESFSMFGGDAAATNEEPGSGSMAKVAGGFAMLVLGSLIGLGVYHFALVPKTSDVPDQKLSVMKTDDIAFSSFEKLRRNVDADPAAYVKEIPPADDAEDYYLIGRAHLLLGDFPKARLALIEAQKQLSKAEPANAKVLNADIALALAITNDPTLQVRLKQEIEANAKLNSSAANTNTNR